MAESNEDLKVRDTLNRYYSSECTVHGGYILSVAVAFFAFLQFANTIVKSFPLPYLFISVVSSLFITAVTYFLARTVLWGTVASFVLHTRKLSEDEARKIAKDDHDEINAMIRLHLACVKRFEDHHRFVKQFTAVGGKWYRRYWAYPIIFTIFFASTYIILGIISGQLVGSYLF